MNRHLQSHLLSELQLPVRDYICQLELGLREQLLTHHGLPHHPSEHTGVFLSPDVKILYQYKMVLNALSVMGPKSLEEKFRQLGAVAYV